MKLIKEQEIRLRWTPTWSLVQVILVTFRKLTTDVKRNSRNDVQVLVLMIYLMMTNCICPCVKRLVYPISCHVAAFLPILFQRLCFILTASVVRRQRSLIPLLPSTPSLSPSPSALQQQQHSHNILQVKRDPWWIDSKGLVKGTRYVQEDFTKTLFIERVAAIWACTSQSSVSLDLDKGVFGVQGKDGSIGTIDWKIIYNLDCQQIDRLAPLTLACATLFPLLRFEPRHHCIKPYDNIELRTQLQWRATLHFMA